MPAQKFDPDELAKRLAALKKKPQSKAKAVKESARTTLKAALAMPAEHFGAIEQDDNLLPPPDETLRPRGGKSKPMMRQQRQRLRRHRQSQAISALVWLGLAMLVARWFFSQF